jgi:alpha-galactosidase
MFRRGAPRKLLAGVVLAGCAVAGVGGGVSAGISPARVMVSSSAPASGAAATRGTALAGSPHAPQPAIVQPLPSRSSALMPNGLALTPPMGWNGYNHFGRTVTAAIVEAAARAMVTSGMEAAGYTYVNLDGGWNLRARSAQGQLQPNPRLFPRGIQPVVDYVHSLGLKFGIYASAGTRNCAGSSAGSYGHYRQDAATFASWGVDYIKFDWCYVPYKDYPSMTHRQVSQMLARQMGQAIAATGRRILYDVNDTVVRTAAWTWAAPVANVWRTTPDIGANYASMVAHFIQDVRDYHYAGRGGWNDPDMLEVGNGAMTPTDSRTQLSLWAEMSAPLIAGNNLTTMSSVTRGILTNRAVIAVDQDPLARQGYPVARGRGHWVLTKPLANGDRAVVLFNQTNTRVTISTTTNRVGMQPAAAYTLRNLWTGALTETAAVITATVPAHGVVMYRVATAGGLSGQ